MTPQAEAAKQQVVDENLAFAYESMLRHLRECTHFDAERVETALWEGVANLIAKSREPI